REEDDREVPARRARVQPVKALADRRHRRLLVDQEAYLDVLVELARLGLPDLGEGSRIAVGELQVVIGVRIFRDAHREHERPGFPRVLVIAGVAVDHDLLRPAARSRAPVGRQYRDGVLAGLEVHVLVDMTDRLGVAGQEGEDPAGDRTYVEEDLDRADGESVLGHDLGLDPDGGARRACPGGRLLDRDFGGFDPPKIFRLAKVEQRRRTGPVPAGELDGARGVADLEYLVDH